MKNDYEIKHTLRNGSCPNFKFKEDQLLERKSLLDPLTNIVTPVADKLVSSYYIILGEHGSGYIIWIIIERINRKFFLFFFRL